MAKDKKAKTADKKARVAQKTEKKAAQKEKKIAKKPKDSFLEDSEAEDDDLDAVLAAYAAQQERFLKVTETITEPPSARASSTIVASPSNDNELFLFGGEYFNGSTAKFFNELHIYNINRDEWRLVTSPNSPLPRSGHAWTRGGNTGGIYLFGGEFSSPKQGTFYHYSDFWLLNPSTREWSKLETSSPHGRGTSKTPQSPSARSGHRMTHFKNYVILFGGFQDTSSSTKYLNDLWLYDTSTFSWHSPILPPASPRPDARSSFSFLPRDDGAVLYGGYSRVKTSSAAKTSGKAHKVGHAPTQTALKPLVHQDTWYLRITPPASDAPHGTLPLVRWERRKRPVNAPQPARAGATMAFHRGRGIQFGGVHDVEDGDEGIESEFYNTLYVWNIERNRFFSLALRRPRTGAKKVVQVERSRRARGKADEEELLANLKALEMRQGLHGAEEEESDEGVERVEEGEEEVRIEKPVSWEMPHPRFNAQLSVQDDVLYIYGGTFEKADREYTFDELWSIDLGSLTGVKQLFKRELEDWQGSDSESEDEEDEEDEEDDRSGDSDDETTNDVDSGAEQSTLASVADDYEPSEADTSTALSTAAVLDDRPHPRPFESLRDFYARTSQEWQDIILEQFKYGSSEQDVKSIKEIRKSAFSVAESKWWDCREDIQALEDEQEAAGIGEVVNLAEKAGENSGAARRR